MATLTHRTELELSADELLALQDVRGARLRLLEGSLWLTLDHDLRDVFLSPGDRFTVDRDGVTLLHALAPVRLSVETFGEAAKLGSTGRWRSAVAALRRLFAATEPCPAGA